MIFVTVGAYAQYGVTVGEGAPQRAALTGGAPAGLVHVHRPGAAHAREQVRVGVGQRVGDASQDRVDRAGADPGAE